MGQRQSYRSSVSTVLGLVLVFLGLLMSAMITPASRVVAPTAKSAQMCWRWRLYRNGARHLQRSGYATSWQLRSRLSARRPCERLSVRDGLAPAGACLPPRVSPQPTWRTLWLQRGALRHSLRGTARAMGKALETFEAIDSS